MLPIPTPPTFRIIAHRGASAYAPENTLPAFELAARMGVHEVELDAQLSTDGQVLLCHDLTLERYGHGSQPVESLTAAAFLSLDMGSWFSPFLFAKTPPLTLDALFTHFADRFVYHVEIKGKAPGLVEAVAALVASYKLAGQTVITSFDLNSLAQMKEVAPTLRRGWLTEQIDEHALQQARDLALFQLCPRAANMTASAVLLARQVPPEVRAWGLGGGHTQVRALIQRVLDAGADGMTIDWPDWVQHREGASNENH
jgi:glycerophosphoryl diester phosphodiesterase